MSVEGSESTGNQRRCHSQDYVDVKKGNNDTMEMVP